VSEGLDLGSWLSRRSVDQLARIIDKRPDSYWGAPLRGLDDFASRLAQPSSVMSAVSRLPLPAMELLQALAALGPRPTVAAAAELLDAGHRTREGQLAALRAALTMLEAVALAWPDDSAPASPVPSEQLIGLNPGVRVVIDEPLGLGRTVAAHLAHTPVEQLRELLRGLGLPDSARREDASRTLVEFLTDRQLVRDLLATAPDSARRRLARLAGGERAGLHPLDQGDREGENWARRRGLLFGGHYYPAEVPVEVILAVRAGEISVRFDPDPPQLDTVATDASALASGAAAAAGEFTDIVAAVVDSMSRSPLPELKSGGVGTREVARTAKALGLTERTMRFALELIRALGLLAAVGVRVGVAESAGRWRSAQPSTRFADLAVAWWGLPITASMTHDPDGKSIPAIGARSADGSAIDLRWTVIRTIGEIAPGSGLAGSDSLAAHLNWHLPGRIATGEPAITVIWAEAHALGVLVNGSLTPIGAALLQGDPEGLLGVAGKLLAPATGTGRFGSDLTVMVAGSPTAAVSALLDSCADRESRGAAVVWRFSPASIRRAMDEGAGAADLLAGLTAIADAGLPQTLTYLIGDVARRHGSLVVHPALCCVRSADEALLIEVAAHRGLRKLRPHLLAPTVIAFQAELTVVLGELRVAGYLPVAADQHGVVVLGRSAGRHATLGGGEMDGDDTGGADTGDAEAEDDPPARMVEELRDLHARSLDGSAADPDSHAAVAELAAALLTTAGQGVRVAGDPNREPTAAEDMVQAFGVQLDEVERRQLAFAIDHQVPVSITYLSATGGTTTRTISDIELVNGLMYAWCHLRDDERVFSLDRVQAVMPVHA